MNHRIILICAFLISVVFTNAAFAQGTGSGCLEPTRSNWLLMGVRCGVNFVRYSTESFTLSGTTYKNGSGIAPMLGINFEFILDEHGTNFILMEALYDSKSGHFTSDNSSSTLSATATYFSLSFGYKHNFLEAYAPRGPGLSVLLGMGLPLVEDQSTNLLQAKRSPVRISVCGEFTYDIPFIIKWGEAIIVTPLAGYDFPLTSVDDSVRNWRASSIYGGVSIRYLW